MNQVILLGRLTRDPEIKDLGGNSRAARYTIAVNREFRTEQGDKADFINCVCFGNTAINAEKYLRKGQLVCVRGWVRTGKYTNRDGITIHTTEVQVERAEFAESKRASEERIKEMEEGNKDAGKVITADIGKSGSYLREPERTHGPVEDDWVNIPDNLDKDNIPFA